MTEMVTSAEKMASDLRRWPVASACCPVTGASSAMNSPAMPTVMPYQVTAESGPGRDFPTVLVRYTEKTKVTTTVLNPDEPQSHRPQANIWLLVTSGLDRPCACAAPGAVLFMRRSVGGRPRPR